MLIGLGGPDPRDACGLSLQRLTAQYIFHQAKLLRIGREVRMVRRKVRYEALLEVGIAYNIAKTPMCKIDGRLQDNNAQSCKASNVYQS
jgi:hypothetical protein